MIDVNENVLCPRCGKKNSLKKWDDGTYNCCTTREMKRAYTKLSLEKAFVRKSDTFYMCPSCKAWSRGCQLKIVDTTDKRLLKLGGESIFFHGMTEKFEN